MISDETKNVLMDAGLTKAQANSEAASKIIDILLSSGGQVLIDEVRAQCMDALKQLQGEVETMHGEYTKLIKKTDGINTVIMEIRMAQAENGNFTDDRARNAAILYASIFGMNKIMRSQPEQIIKTAEQVTCAYLTGQELDRRGQP